MRKFIVALCVTLVLAMCLTPMVLAVDSTDGLKIDNNKKYAGVYITSPDDASYFGNNINIIAWFDNFDSDSSRKISLCLDENKYIAFITLQPAGMKLSDIAAGEYDEKIITYLSRLSAGNRVNSELFIRFAHEFEMRPKYKKGWYEWQSKDYETYIAAWKHVVDLGREYAPNVKWVWSPNRADEYTEPYYPGDDYVDYVSLSLNNYKESYKTFQSFYEEVGQRSYIEAYNKPIIFGETGEHCDNEDQKKEYIESLVDFVNDYDNAIGFVILNDNVVNGDGENRNYRFSDDEEILVSFNENSRKMINQ